MVSSSVRVRPTRSAIRPKTIPPVAQPTSRTEVMIPVHSSVALRASGEPMGMPSKVGTQLGATQLNRMPSKTSNPQPSHAAASTPHW